MATSNNSSAPLDLQDVGFIFVREYYTFLHKKPHRLHAFYSDDSIFARGDEGTDPINVKGKEEIRKKIESCQFEDCKVLVTQVDSQGSANNGILVQVLGEMCNQNGPSQKFSQTFFLATQPNGYYILNDIFRFLKDEVDIDYYTCEDVKQPETVVIDIPASPVVQAKKEEVKKEEIRQEQLRQEQLRKEEIKKEEAKKEEIKKEEAKKEEIKKEEAKKEEIKREEAKKEDIRKEEIRKEEAKKEEAKKEEAKKEEAKKEQSKKEQVVDQVKKAEPAAKEETPVEEKKKTKTESKQKKEQQKKDNKPSAAHTWATLTAAAPPSPVVAHGTVTPTAPVVPAVVPTVVEAPVVNTEKPQQAPQQNKPQAPRKEATNIFVKQVTEAINEEQLAEAFSKIGSVKSCSISRPRNCAFIEFNSPESCQKALAQHKVIVGNHTVHAEERRFSNQNNNRYNSGGRVQQQPYERRTNNNTNSNSNRRGGGTGTGQPRMSSQPGKGRGTPTPTPK